MMSNEYQRLADEALAMARSTTDKRAQGAIEEIAYTWARLARGARQAIPEAASVGARPGDSRYS